MDNNDKILKVTYLDGEKETCDALTRPGKAVIEFKNGDRYEGEVDQGDQGELVKQGEGKYEWSSGAVYKGSYKNGKKHGKGTYVYPGGGQYDGEWADGVKSGKGSETFENGDSYEGSYANGVFNGQGVYSYTSGATLTGSWEDGELLKGSWQTKTGSRRLSTRAILSKLGKRLSVKNTNKNALKLRRQSTRRPLGVIISGAPASGKGTQCEFIREEFGLCHLSTGDILRAAVAAGSELGMKAKALMEAGQLVPDDIVIGAVKERLSQDDVKQTGFLLDGFPRTAAQAEALAELGVKVDIFLMLNVPDEALVARVVGRRIDPETGNSYHVDFNPPPPEIEDRVIQRADDTEEKVKVRLQGFHKNISAIKDFYTDVTVEIDGTQQKEKVWSEIQAAMEAVKFS